MKRTLSIVLASLMSASAWGADLMSVYRDALKYDARFMAAKAQREAGQEKSIQGRAGVLPGIGMSATTTWNDNTYTGTDRSFNSNTYGAELRQPLFNRAAWTQYEQGKLQTTLADAQFEQARQDLIIRVSEAYFAVLNAQDAAEALRSLRTAATQQLELAKKSFEVGTVTITDVHEAQSRFDLASARLIAAENELEVARQRLAQIIGKEPEAVAGLRTGVELGRPQPDDMRQWVSSAEQDSYGVQIQQIATRIADREVVRNESGHLPTLDVVARYNQSDAGGSNFGAGRTENTIRTIGLELNVPLYQGGAVSSRTREAAALLTKAEADLDDARRSAALAARQSYLGVTSGLAQVKALEAAEVSSRSALDANRLGYEVGVRINIDVLNAQSQLADTQQQLAKARYDTLIAQLRLAAAAGALSEQDVERLNALLTTAP
ncbi:TolC family outer membrane protein [Denitromonas iodatirespirans]|uniref:TolC family outer membrane protein n=1 Tax=Denitromonas iodatirespirans TaxID=2795389 RepID=A0A944DBF7_DENI1|nr:TolC family outer membrane protein [Denitromonas iodatirespirans]MBT0962307.1 TolC family outer membrane protein [Denitromonas iodatirespirans]